MVGLLRAVRPSSPSKRIALRFFKAAIAYLFLDYGQVTENAGENTRGLAGVGLGVQFSNKCLSLDLSLVQRLSMAASSVDPSNRDPQFWTSVNINF